MTAVQLLVMAKAPVAGRVKTRLCPPCTPDQAARIATAALADTLDAAGAAPVARRTIVMCGQYAASPGWHRVAQRGTDLADRLVHGYADTADPVYASLLIGMDTPQVTPDLLAEAVDILGDARVDAILGPAADGGWWALGLRDPDHARVLRQVPTSTPRTGADTIRALRSIGLRLALLPVLRDVDTAADARGVAAECRPDSRFARVVRVELAQPAGVVR
jgi:uncharacterized protein